MGVYPRKSDNKNGTKVNKKKKKKDNYYFIQESKTFGIGRFRRKIFWVGGFFLTSWLYQKKSLILQSFYQN